MFDNGLSISLHPGYPQSPESSPPCSYHLIGVVYWRWVRVAIAKPSDEPLRKGETQGNIFPAFYILVTTHLFPTCSRDMHVSTDRILLSNATRKNVLSVISSCDYIMTPKNLNPGNL